MSLIDVMSLMDLYRKCFVCVMLYPLCQMRRAEAELVLRSASKRKRAKAARKGLAAAHERYQCWMCGSTR